jgi:folate-dependent phosphoribosylglycinamide formyltransferase PurN
MNNELKIFSICGNHSRHLYYLNEISQKFNVNGSIIQTRENILPSLPENISDQDRKNFDLHFQNRDIKEKEYFKNQNYPNHDILEVKPEELNLEKSIKFLKSKNPDVVLIFGSDLIKEPFYNHLPKDSINLHLGLSPRYRGAAGLFWPFYFLEPNLAGCTFHHIISEPDAGEIIHQSLPDLNKNDGIHDVACKAVISATQDMCKLLKIREDKGFWNRFQQKGTGKNFLNSDFKPEHLRLIYNLFHDEIVKEYLQGNISSRKMNIIKQF